MREELVRHYIRQILKEEDGGDGGSFGYGGDGGGYGWDPGSDSFSKALVQPFTDVIQTARAEGEKILAKTETLVAYLIRGMAASLIPFMKADYSDIDERDRERMDRIKSKYADVYKRTDDAFKEEDFRLALFLWKPHEFMASDQAFTGPKAALKALEVISGGNDYVRRFSNAAREKMDAMTITQESLLREDRSKGFMKKVMAVPGIQKALKQSKVIPAMQNDAKKLVSHHIQDVISHAKRAVDQLSSPDGLLKLAGDRIDKKALDAYAKLDSQQQQQMVNHIKKMVKTFYGGRLKSEAKNFESAPELQTFFHSGISAISSM